MYRYRIRGGAKLAGAVAIGGAKNAALPIMAALLMNSGVTRLSNCPRIADTFLSADILQALGCRVSFKGDLFRAYCDGPLTCKVPAEYATAMRSSILFAGALLARVGCAEVPLPGGCAIGERAIDMHIEGLRMMGAEIKCVGDTLICVAKRLKGAKIKLRFPSVGATENLMIAACGAEGITTIENAAQEPEIRCLARFLRGMGEKVTGDGTSIIVVTGAPKNTQYAREIHHRIMPDRIVAGTYLAAAAITGGDLHLTHVGSRDLVQVAKKLRLMGCEMYLSYDKVRMIAPRRLRPVNITTAVHPGFPTDMQAQFMAALATADGVSKVTERIFSSRFAHANELVKMGADISITGETAFIRGAEKLRGAEVQARDLRCGAALILAGLAADGETIVNGAEYVMRGYENIEKDLRQLGADIVLENTSV